MVGEVGVRGVVVGEGERVRVGVELNGDGVR